MKAWRSIVLGAVVLSACIPSFGPSNPYDPATPVEEQAKATLRGVVSG